MTLTPVQSSNIAAIGHDAETSTLTVQFASGACYAYADVPRGEYDAFLDAESKGRFFAAHVRNNPAYPCTKAAPVPPVHATRIDDLMTEARALAVNITCTQQMDTLVRYAHQATIHANRTALLVLAGEIIAAAVGQDAGVAPWHRELVDLLRTTGTLRARS